MNRRVCVRSVLAPVPSSTRQRPSATTPARSGGMAASAPMSWMVRSVLSLLLLLVVAATGPILLTSSSSARVQALPLMPGRSPISDQVAADSVVPAVDLLLSDELEEGKRPLPSADDHGAAAAIRDDADADADTDGIRSAAAVAAAAATAPALQSEREEKERDARPRGAGEVVQVESNVDGQGRRRRQTESSAADHSLRETTRQSNNFNGLNLPPIRPEDQQEEEEEEEEDREEEQGGEPAPSEAEGEREGEGGRKEGGTEEEEEQELATQTTPNNNTAAASSIPTATTTTTPPMTPTTTTATAQSTSAASSSAGSTGTPLSLTLPPPRPTTGTDVDAATSLAPAAGDAEAEAAEAKAPKLILEMYKNLTATGPDAHPGIDPFEDNTIRSFEIGTQGVPLCGEFNFTMGSISRQEFVTKAELNIYLVPDPVLVQAEGEGREREGGEREGEGEGGQEINKPVQHFHVVIRSYTSSGELAVVSSRNISTHSSGMQKFSVSQTVIDWADEREMYNDSHTHDNNRNLAFKLEVYNSQTEFHSGKAPLSSCNSKLNFVFDRAQKDKMPLLVVFSYDPNADQLVETEALERLLAIHNATTDLDATEEDTEEEEEEEEERVENEVESRSKRRILHQCSRMSLNFSRDDLNELKLIKGATITDPEILDAGICGGQCSHFPRGPKHALIAYYFIQSNKFRSMTFGETCVPYSYSHHSFLTQEDDSGLYVIKTVPHMKVDSCSCVNHMAT